MIIGTCGHELKGLGCNIAVKSYTRQYEKAIDYMVVCKECKKMYEKDGLLINNKKEMEQYLHENMY